MFLSRFVNSLAVKVRVYSIIIILVYVYKKSALCMILTQAESTKLFELEFGKWIT